MQFDLELEVVQLCVRTFVCDCCKNKMKCVISTFIYALKVIKNKHVARAV